MREIQERGWQTQRPSRKLGGGEGDRQREREREKA